LLSDFAPNLKFVAGNLIVLAAGPAEPARAAEGTPAAALIATRQRIGLFIVSSIRCVIAEHTFAKSAFQGTLAVLPRDVVNG
jgi:hypothetical protein